MKPRLAVSTAFAGIRAKSSELANSASCCVRPTFFSVAFEAWFSLFIEGFHSFLAIRGIDQPIVGLDFEAVARQKVRLQAVMDRFLRLAHREGRVGGDRLSGGERLFQELARLADAVDDAPLE